MSNLDCWTCGGTCPPGCCDRAARSSEPKSAVEVAGPPTEPECTCGPWAPYSSHEWSCPQSDGNRAEAALAPWFAACDAVGVPHDPDGLIRHHRNNAAAAAQMDAYPLAAAAGRVERAWTQYLESDVVDEMAEAIGELRAALGR